MNQNEKSTKRLVSLDAFRGLAIIGMISGGLSQVGLNDIPIIGAFFRNFSHVHWVGLHFYDLVFPFFLFITGVSLPFSIAKRRSLGQSESEIRRHMFVRLAILFAMGAVLESVRQDSPQFIELSSAVQPIGFAYVVSYFLLDVSTRVRILIGAGIIGLYWLILTFVPGPGVAAGTLEFKNNMVWSLDMSVLGRAERGGWGTLVLFFPQIANTLYGTVAGDLIRRASSAVEIARSFAVAAVVGCLGGLILHQFVPCIMKIWTPSYIVASVGFSFLGLLIFYWIIDVWKIRRWSYFFVVFGMNPLLLYMFNRLFGGQYKSIVGIFSKEIGAWLGPIGPLFEWATAMAVLFWIFHWLYKRRVFVKA